MTSAAKKLSQTAGLPPGTLVYVGDHKKQTARITLFDFDVNQYKEQEIFSVEECFPFKDSETITWINIDGLHDVDVIEKIDSRFGIHPLVLEDILNTEQRPKIEDYGDYVFITLKMFNYNPELDEVTPEQISMIFGSNYVITFQESQGDSFNPIRDRIRNNKGRVRRMGADYLAYALLDTIIDDYFVILERLGEKIELFEDQLMGDTDNTWPHKIHQLKREVILLRRYIWPLREVVGGFQRIESNLINKATGIFLRDAYDHTIQVMDTIESYRDMLSGMHDVYLSSLSIRMNEVMKFLTIFTAIFSPLTFLAGIYGMNFQHMPELHWVWGYPFILVIMATITSLMLIYFKQKKWL